MGYWFVQRVHVLACLHESSNGFVGKFGRRLSEATKSSQVNNTARGSLSCRYSSVALNTWLPFVVLFPSLWERQFQRDGKWFWCSLLCSVAVFETACWSFVTGLGLFASRTKSAKQLVFSVINVSESLLMIPAVCWIENPVAKENNLDQCCSFGQDGDSGERKYSRTYPNLWNLQLFNFWTARF